MVVSGFLRDNQYYQFKKCFYSMISRIFFLYLNQEWKDDNKNGDGIFRFYFPNILCG